MEEVLDLDQKPLDTEDIGTLCREMQAWQKPRNAEQKQVDRQFTTEDARVRLKHLYPNI